MNMNMPRAEDALGAMLIEAIRVPGVRFGGQQGPHDAPRHYGSQHQGHMDGVDGVSANHAPVPINP